MVRSDENRPLVSIIIPCWNAESLVGKAIDSALAQTYRPIEVIVIDDGSTDGSLSVIKSYGDRIRHETGPNRGGAAARNRGLALARGELIQFLDADDELFPGRLTQMVPLAVSSGPKAMPVSDWETVSAISGDIRTHNVDYDGNDPVVFFLDNTLQTSSPLHWRQNIDAVDGFDGSLPCSQERDLHLRLAVQGLEVIHCPKVLYVLLDREGSVSDDFVKVLDQHGRIFMRVHALLEERGELTVERRDAIARALSRDGRFYAQRGHDEKASRSFELANQVSEGGARSGFGRWYSRLLAGIAGPVRAEHLIQRVSGLRAGHKGVVA